jgi:hypothetical protein
MFKIHHWQAMYLQNILLGATAGLAVSPRVSAGSTDGQAACTSAAIPHPKVFGVEILDLSVAEHRNETTLSGFGSFPANLTVSYCGVNVYVREPDTIRYSTDP